MFDIDGIPFGYDSPPVVIAEIGINHGGNLGVAIEIADAAIDAGITFIKHQTHIPDAEMSVEAKSVYPGNADRPIYDVISEAALSEADEWQLMNHVKERGAVFFSTPFSREAADRLDAWNVPMFKIGSGECNNYPLVSHIAKFGKPVIMSTGMNSVASIRPSVEILRNSDVPFALLHTTNLYPTPSKLIRLGGLRELAEEFPDAVIGLSDHSTSNNACIASVALGARILERHFVHDKNAQGPDISSSMGPEDAIHLLSATLEVFEASGGEKNPVPEEAVTMAFAFSSVVTTRPLEPGDTLSEHNIWVKRPGDGDFGPGELEALYGRTVVQRVPSGVQLKRADVDPAE